MYFSPPKVHGTFHHLFESTFDLKYYFLSINERLPHTVRSCICLAHWRVERLDI